MLAAFAFVAAILILLPQWHDLLFANAGNRYYIGTHGAHDFAAALVWTLLIAGLVFFCAHRLSKSSSSAAQSATTPATGTTARRSPRSAAACIGSVLAFVAHD